MELLPAPPEEVGPIGGARYRPEEEMIDPASVESLKEAVESVHGCTAKFVQAVHVRERFKAAPVWEGVVHIFELKGNPKASRAYAWSSSTERSLSRGVYAVLHIPPISSPAAAVRASIAAEYSKRFDA